MFAPPWPECQQTGKIVLDRRRARSRRPPPSCERKILISLWTAMQEGALPHAIVAFCTPWKARVLCRP